jgi:hypothetical protein
VNREPIELPLGELEVPSPSRNRQLVEDYSYWFWNYTDDDTFPTEDGGGSFVQRTRVSPSPVRQLIYIAVAGGLVGCILGPAWYALGGASIAIQTGAGILALLGAAVGRSLTANAPRIPGITTGRWTVPLLGLVAGGVVGGLLGAMLIGIQGAAVGGFLGGVGGWFVSPARYRRRGAWWGGILGAVVGTVVLAFLRDAEAARTGLGTGGIAGLIAGPALWLVFVLTAGLLEYEE